MAFLEYWIERINSWVWGPPLLIFLILVGVYLTIRTRGVQLRYLWYAHKLAFSRHDNQSMGDISHFQALMTALAATIGIGSITGVATAIMIGGLGSLVWMWIAALVGMATKYAEAILAVKYRVVDDAGEMCGGPMYYLTHGLKKKWLAVLFAVFGAISAFGIGNMAQTNSVAHALSTHLNVPPIWSGVLLMVVTGVALIGGIKSIGKVASILVPAMGIFYVLGGLLIIALRITDLPATFGLIFRSAFQGQAALGGFAGAGVMVAIQLGISRGVFSSEAGLGTSSIAAAAAKTDTPGRQALVSMCTVFLTTGIVCSITGLVIALSGMMGKFGPDGKLLDGSALALSAFDQILPYSGLIVTISIVPFAYSTILGWAYYGEKCIEFLFGFRATKPYRVIFTLFIIVGALSSLGLVWSFSNMMNGLMAIPNLIALFALAGVVSKETKFFDALVKKERTEARK